MVKLQRLQDNAALRALARRCWPKRQHASQGAAQAALRSLLKRGLEKDAARLHAYECPHCRAWHTGHSADTEATS